MQNGVRSPTNIHILLFSSIVVRISLQSLRFDRTRQPRMLYIVAAAGLGRYVLFSFINQIQSIERYILYELVENSLQCTPRVPLVWFGKLCQTVECKEYEGIPWLSGGKDSERRMMIRREPRRCESGGPRMCDGLVVLLHLLSYRKCE